MDCSSCWYLMGLVSVDLSSIFLETPGSVDRHCLYDTVAASALSKLGDIRTPSDQRLKAPVSHP